MNRSLLLLVLLTSNAANAAVITLIDENYDSLTVGQTLPGWQPWQPAQNPTNAVVQNTNFLSAPHGASITNDTGAQKLFGSVSGVLSINVWIDPKLGSDTNFGVQIFRDDAPLGNLALLNVNSNDQLLLASGTSLGTAQPGGYDLHIDFFTATGTYDLYLNGTLEADDVFVSSWVGQSIGAFGFTSGRGGVGTTSYWDDLLVTFDAVPEPPIATLVGLGLMVVVCSRVTADARGEMNKSLLPHNLRAAENAKRA